MQMRLAKFHFVQAFEDLLGIRPPPPGHTGDTMDTWRMAPGQYPRGYGVRSYGGLGLVSAQWDPSRPVIWDVDLPFTADSGLAVFCSGVLIRDHDGWRYFEPPDRDPFLLAAVVRGSAMSIVARSQARFPFVLPETQANAWADGVIPWENAVRSLPRVERTWFRSSLVAPPDHAPGDTPDIITPMLALVRE